MNLAERTGRIVLDDLDPAFVESLGNFAAWEYSTFYETLSADSSLTPELRLDLFRSGRGLVMNRAIVRAANKHGIPFEVRRLACNGQSKLMVKVGRVILISEALKTMWDKPKAADYKREISGCYGIIQQLEFDLGDRPKQLLDWSDGVLGVILHGAAGMRFRRSECELGAFILGLPDAEYQSWLMRLDLHDIAMFGVTHSSKPQPAYDEYEQEDRVIVKRRSVRQIERSNG